MYLAYVSKHNSNREKLAIMLMILNGQIRVAKSKGQQWHDLAVKKLSALLRGVTSKNKDYFNCQICLHSFRTKSKIEWHKKACENKNICNANTPSDNTRTLEFNYS